MKYLSVQQPQSQHWFRVEKWMILCPKTFFNHPKCSPFFVLFFLTSVCHKTRICVGHSFWYFSQMVGNRDITDQCEDVWKCWAFVQTLHCPLWETHLNSTMLLFSRSNPPGFLLQCDCVCAAWWRSAADDWDELAPGCCWETDDASRERDARALLRRDHSTADRINIYIHIYIHNRTYFIVSAY